MKFINKMRKFMYGRYGADELYKFLLVIYIIIVVLNMFLKSLILGYIEFFVLIFMLYRFFSKNLYQRRKENKLYLKLKKGVLSPFLSLIKSIKDKENIYKKCSKCKRILRLPLPSSIGIKHVICPNCKKRLSILCLRRQKVEIIKAKGD